MTLIINGGEFTYEQREFNQAVRELQEEYGYEGFAWEMVVASGDLEILADFLASDGLYIEYDE